MFGRCLFSPMVCLVENDFLAVCVYLYIIQEAKRKKRFDPWSLIRKVQQEKG